MDLNNKRANSVSQLVGELQKQLLLYLELQILNPRNKKPSSYFVSFSNLVQIPIKKKFCECVNANKYFELLKR